MFFSEEKNQKTFIRAARLGVDAPPVHPRQRIDVFCFFFSKKQRFLPFTMIKPF
jgi:hypothetical protein